MRSHDVSAADGTSSIGPMPAWASSPLPHGGRAELTTQRAKGGASC